MTGVLSLSCLPFVMLEWFGGGTSAGWSSNANALACAFAEGKRIELGQGVYKFDPVAVNVLDGGNDFVMTGQSRHSSILEFPEGGLEVELTPTSAGNFLGKALGCRIENLGFRSSGAGWDALKVAIYANDGNIRAERILKNLSFSGTAPGCYFEKGVEIQNASYFVMEDIFYRSFMGAGTAVVVSGDLDSLDNSITRLFASECGTGLHVTGKSEGLSLTDSRLVNLTNGVVAQPYLSASETCQPWLSARGNHVAATSRGFLIQDTTHVMADGNLVYLLADGAVGFDLMRSLNKTPVGLHTLTGNQVQSQAVTKASSIGIRMQAAGTGNHDHSNISNNTLTNLNIGVQLFGGTDNCGGQGNRAVSCNMPLNDNGSGNTVSVVAS